MSQTRFGKVVIHGVGLMGGSLGLALLNRGLTESVWGLGRNDLRLRKAVEAGVLTHATTLLPEAAQDADLIVIGLPVRLIPQSAVAFAHQCPESALITDMGSTKAEIISEIEPELEERACTFIGSHPMCGSEKAGFEAAREDLFDGAVCAVTPTSLTPPDEMQRLCGFWEAVGGRVVELDPPEHDRLVARTSHLPRAVATALCHALEYEMDADKRDLLVATGFMGMTRTASSSEELWTQILSSNSENLLDALGDLQTTLKGLHDMLSLEDTAALRQWLQTGRDIRDNLKQTPKKTRQP